MRSILLLVVLAHLANITVAFSSGWHALASAPHPSTRIRLTFVLKLQNSERLEQQLLAVSTPVSPTYGHYVNLDDLNRAYPTIEDAAHIVQAWLRSAGTVRPIQVDASAHGFVVVDLEIGVAEKLFETPFAE